MDVRIFELRNNLLEHLDDDWTVEKMAKKAGISLSHFPVVFKEFLKNSPVAYLKQKRLGKAKHLIETTYDHIDQIGIQVGMRDPSISRAISKTDSASPRPTQFPTKR